MFLSSQLHAGPCNSTLYRRTKATWSPSNLPLEPEATEQRVPNSRVAVYSRTHRCGSTYPDRDAPQQRAWAHICVFHRQTSPAHQGPGVAGQLPGRKRPPVCTYRPKDPDVQAVVTLSPVAIAHVAKWGKLSLCRASAVVVPKWKPMHSIAVVTKAIRNHPTVDTGS